MLRKSVIAVIERYRKQGLPRKPVFAVWIGGGDRAAEIVDAAGIPSTQPNPMRSPASCIWSAISASLRRDADGDATELAAGFCAGCRAVRPIIEAALRERGTQRAWLDPVEMTRRFLGLRDRQSHRRALRATRTKPSRLTKPHLAEGNAVVLKIQSPDIVHKSEVGGVRLNLTTVHAVRRGGRGHSRAGTGGEARGLDRRRYASFR